MSELPDPNSTGPCVVESSILCTGIGRRRLNPLAMLDAGTAFAPGSHTLICDPCYARNADLYIERSHQ